MPALRGAGTPPPTAVTRGAAPRRNRVSERTDRKAIGRVRLHRQAPRAARVRADRREHHHVPHHVPHPGRTPPTCWPARTRRRSASPRSSVQLGLNKPIYVQYGRFVDRLVHGNFGESYQFERPVRQMLQSAIPNTAQLAFAAVLIELLGIPLGVYSALRQYTIWDSALTTTALIIWGIPVFVLGGLHAVRLRGLPGHPALLRHRRQHGSSGSSPPTGTTSRTSSCRPSPSASSRSPTSRTCSAPPCSRSSAPTTCARPAPRASPSARSSSSTASRTPLIPVMTIAGIDLGALLGGAILTETVFYALRRRPHGLQRHRRPRPAGRGGRRAVRHLRLRHRQPGGRRRPTPTSTRASAMSSGR